MNVFQTGGIDTVSDSMTIAQPIQNKIAGFRTKVSDSGSYIEGVEVVRKERGQ